jgi:outer membrane murein-binding lipoprotein Lpp
MMNRNLGVSLGVAATLFLAGCSSTPPQTSATDQQLIDQQNRRISELEVELDTKEKQLAAAEAAKAAEPAATASTATATNALFPPNPEPGHCYARVLLPAQYRTETETVLKKEASSRIEVVPARYETVAETVMVKEASTLIETIPARYETVTEQVLVRPETTRLEHVPATYRTETEQVMVAPARTEWKRGPASAFADAGVLETSTTDTGEVICLVEVPPVYETVTRQVLDQPATTREVVVPAEYKTITKTVLAEPATTREIEVPAEYATIEVTKLVAPAEEREIEIPAEYETVSKRVKVGDEQLEWREVLCEVNLTPDNIRRLQVALNDKGYNVGTPDGILGPQTLRAANSFAKSNGLPYGTNYIAIETAENLGLNL